MWAAAKQPDSIVAQVLYIQVTTSAMRAVTHQTIDFLPGFLYSAIFIGAIAWYAKEQPVVRAPVWAAPAPRQLLPK